MGVLLTPFSRQTSSSQFRSYQEVSPSTLPWSERLISMIGHNLWRNQPAKSRKIVSRNLQLVVELLTVMMNNKDIRKSQQTVQGKNIVQGPICPSTGIPKQDGFWWYICNQHTTLKSQMSNPGDDIHTAMIKTEKLLWIGPLIHTADWRSS